MKVENCLSIQVFDCISSIDSCTFVKSSSTSFLLGLQDGSVIKVVEEQYTVREARIHVRHVRDLLKSADNTDAYSGVDCASLSFLNTVCHGDGIAPHERRKNNSATGGMPAGNGAAIDCTPPEFLLPSR